MIQRRGTRIEHSIVDARWIFLCIDNASIVSGMWTVRNSANLRMRIATLFMIHSLASMETAEGETFLMQIMQV